MSSITTSQPMSLFKIEFQELFGRHLCRHSQFGINVAHLAALFGTWYAVYGVVYWLCREDWVLVALAVSYLAVLVPNVPLRVLAATTCFQAIFLAALLSSVPFMPEWIVWVYLAMIPVFYKLQSWSHKLWSVETDMTEWNKKYTKGYVLFIVLLFYEVPIVLNYLLFGRKAAPVSPTGALAPPEVSEPLTLDEHLRGVTDENRPGKWNTGPAVGKEVL